jgi:hypothetical protein
VCCAVLCALCCVLCACDECAACVRAGSLLLELEPLELEHSGMKDPIHRKKLLRAIADLKQNPPTLPAPASAPAPAPAPALRSQPSDSTDPMNDAAPGQPPLLTSTSSTSSVSGGPATPTLPFLLSPRHNPSTAAAPPRARQTTTQTDKQKEREKELFDLSPLSSQEEARLAPFLPLGGHTTTAQLHQFFAVVRSLPRSCYAHVLTKGKLVVGLLLWNHRILKHTDRL